MKNEAAEWQELHAHIEKFREKYLMSMLEAIEYKPGEVQQLLDMPSRYETKYLDTK